MKRLIWLLRLGLWDILKVVLTREVVKNILLYEGLLTWRS
jgi:hypothetical protein